MNYPWPELKFWSSGEWQVAEEKLNDLRRKHTVVNPSINNLFRALDLVKLSEVRVAFLGQDPYPSHDLATGLAFSIPDIIKSFPPTLNCIFDEYESDLHLPRPKSGSLEGWAKQGVLLWNVIPTCTAGHSLSHDWAEWFFLTTEIIEKLKEKGVVFVFLGTRARAYASLVKEASNCITIETSHPSPRASLRSRTTYAFRGSRLFSRINDALNTLGLETIDWRL